MMKQSEEKAMHQNEIENVKDEEEGTPITRKGGFITVPFILANDVFDTVANAGLRPNMIVYLMNDYKLSVTNAQNLLFFWNIACNFTPVLGGLLADSFLGRFVAISIGSVFSFLGLFVLWMTTIIPQAKPPPCDLSTSSCPSPTTGQFAFLVFGFVLMAIGGGGIVPCSRAFGADQIDQQNNTKNSISLETFLNWYYMLNCVSAIIALTVIVYLQDHFGWMIGFGVPVVLMFLAIVSFFLASPFYVKVKADKNLLINLVQVIVAAWKNRKLNVYDIDLSSQVYYYGKDSDVSEPTEKFRWLNKACIIQNPEEDIGPNGLASNPWRLCKVEDVEKLKALLRVIPMLSTSIMIYVNLMGDPFRLLLTRTMDRRVGPSFEIPTASFYTIMIFVVGVWIPFYNRVLLPLASKIRGKNVTLSPKSRIGLSIVFSFLSVLSSGIIESIRRQKAIDSGFEDDPLAVIEMSAMWTVPSSIFAGIADAFFVVGYMEFLFTEFPKSMLSIATSVFGLLGTFASLIASLILNTASSVTKSGENDGWIANNVNKGHYDYYYYLLAGLSLINMLYYVYCSSIYGPTKMDQLAKEDDNKDDDTITPLLRNEGDVLKTC